MSTPDDPFDRLRDSLVAAARREEEHRAPSPATPRAAPARRYRRPLFVLALALGLTGTAAAGVVVTQDDSKGPTSQLNERVVTAAKPAGPNLSPLTKDSKAYNNAGLIAPGVDWDGDVLGTTVQRGPVFVDVLTDRTKTICFGSRTTEKFSGGACASLPIPARRIPFEGGRSGDISWVAAFAPDGVKQLEGVTEDGHTETASFEDNIAVVSASSFGEFVRVSWRTPAGDKISQEVAR
jgi:hypothetical protein